MRSRGPYIPLGEEDFDGQLLSSSLFEICEVLKFAPD